MIVQCIYGPFHDQRLTLSDADGAAAIAEKWAYDPLTRDPWAPPVEMTPEEQGDAIEAATHAAAVLRGEVTEPPAERSVPRHAEAEHEARTPRRK